MPAHSSVDWSDGVALLLIEADLSGIPGLKVPGQTVTVGITRSPSWLAVLERARCNDKNPVREQAG